MNFINPDPATNGGYDVTVSSSAGGAGAYHITFTQAKSSDLYRDASNRAAENALVYGTRGYEVTARVWAELADAYAELVTMYEWSESRKAA